MYKELFVTTYLVIGWEDAKSWASLHKEFKTESSARKFIEKSMASGNFERIMLRKEEAFIGNNENLDISMSTPLESFDIFLKSIE